MSGTCHCGEPIAYGFDGDPTHERGMCEHCDAARCDAYPGACRPDYRGAPLLARASGRIRHDVEFGQAHGDDAFLLSVADWLDNMARALVGTSYGDLPFEGQAVDVARAYLNADG